MARKRPAPYVPLSVYYADDEAIMEAGEDAELMYVRMLAYAGRTPTTEGYVPKRVCLTRLGIAARPELGPETSPESRLERLTDTGLVAVEGDGYRLVSWLKWNRSVEEMNREQAQDRARKVPLTRSAPETGPEDVPETGPETAPESSPVPSGSTEAEEKRRTTSARTRAKSKTDMPKGWQPHAKHIEKCRSLGLDAAFLAEQFAHFHEAKGNQFVNWDAAFFTWIGNATSFGSSNQQPRLRVVNDGRPEGW